MKTRTMKELRKWEGKGVAMEMYSKIKGSIEPGSRVAIYWRGEEKIIDKGYAFQIEEADNPDSLFIHIPSPENPGGKDSCDSEWRHIFDLLSNPQLLKIKVL